MAKDEYFCPDCGQVHYEPGICPICGQPMTNIDTENSRDSEYNRDYMVNNADVEEGDRSLEDSFI